MSVTTCAAWSARHAPHGGTALLCGYVRYVVERVTPSVLAAQTAGTTEQHDAADQAVEGGMCYRFAAGSAELVVARSLDAVAAAS
ncbi:hypothetical protein [Streptomyces sp. NPDC050534]|uniref:hypothetical protein n=1 Tax=Streptomyces sp. NPDC050534 TaxID=3365625 RepID=UPI0037B4F677